MAAAATAPPSSGTAATAKPAPAAAAAPGGSRSRGPRGGARGKGRGGARSGARGSSGKSDSGSSRGGSADSVSEGTIKVKPASPITGLAGAIAHTLRASGKCDVACIGAPAVNQAVKGIMLARLYLETDGKDLRVAAAINKAVGPNALQLTVSAQGARTELPGDDAEATFRVGGDTRHFKLAGAVASRFREGAASPLICQGMGASAVLQMVKAAALVQEYLVDDGMTACFAPSRTTVTSADSEERTVMRLVLFASK